jgi:hypothetical protein
MKKLNKIKPMFNRIITTMDTYEHDQYVNGLLDTSKARGSLKEYQTVLAVGTTVRDIKEGDVVCIDPTRYMVTKHKDKSLQGNIVGDEIAVGYKFNTIKLQDKDCLMLFDQDISFIVEESEDVEDPTGPLIIQPERPSIIV